MPRQIHLKPPVIYSHYLWSLEDFFSVNSKEIYDISYRVVDTPGVRISCYWDDSTKGWIVSYLKYKGNAWVPVVKNKYFKTEDEAVNQLYKWFLSNKKNGKSK